MTEQDRIEHWQAPATLTRLEAERLVGSYVSGVLTGTELERFEIFLLENPDFLTVAVESELIAEALRTTPSGVAPMDASVSTAAGRRWAAPHLALAAAFALSVFLNLWQAGTHQSNGSALRGLAVTGELRLGVRNGTAQRYPLMTVAQDLLTLKVDVGLEPPARYRSVLEGPEGLRLQFPPAADTTEYLTLLLPEARAGVYVLRVEQQLPESDEATAWQPFRRYEFELLAP